MAIEIRRYEDSLRAAWEDLCRTAPEAWFWHTRCWADYSYAYAAERVAADESFVVCLDGRLVALCPVFAERTASDAAVMELAYAGADIPAPAISADCQGKQRDRVRFSMYQHLERLAAQHGAARVRLAQRTVPDERSDIPGRVFEFNQFGFLTEVFLTQIVDLTLSQEALWSGLRGSYRPLINRAGRELEVNVYSNERLPGPAFARYQETHARAAGRVTRSQATFDCMRSWVESGTALLVEAAVAGDSLAFSLAIRYKDGAYYASSCALPDSDLPYLQHIIQWVTIRTLRDGGARWYELGEQAFAASLTHPAQPKETAISFFKRGFGGSPRIRVRGERYFSEPFFRRSMGERIEGFLHVARITAPTPPLESSFESTAARTQDS